MFPIYYCSYFAFILVVSGFNLYWLITYQREGKTALESN